LTKVASYNQYSGNKQTAGWLLDENIAFLYRAFSTYDHDVHLAFAQPQYPGLPEINFGFAPASLQLQLDLSGAPGWTKIELVAGAQSLLQLTPAGISQSLLNLDVPFLSSGVYGLSALVTHADGHTLSTTNLLVYTAVPEPGVLSMSLIAAAVLMLSMRSIAPAIRQREQSNKFRESIRRLVSQ